MGAGILVLGIAGFVGLEGTLLALPLPPPQPNKASNILEHISDFCLVLSKDFCIVIYLQNVAFHLP